MYHGTKSRSLFPSHGPEGGRISRVFREMWETRTSTFLAHSAPDLQDKTHPVTSFQEKEINADELRTQWKAV
jgi:hypothetical protein